MQAHDQVVLIGASGFGRESLDVLEAMCADGAALDILGVVDDAPSEVNLERLAKRNVPYLGTIDNWLDNKPRGIRFLLGIGNPVVRRKLARQLEDAGLTAFSAIHPTAVIGSQPAFDSGVVVCAGAVVSTNVRLGRHVHINPNATIGHDSVLEDFVSVNPAAVISGEVLIKQEVLIGAAALVLQQLSVGERTIVGAAALVTKHVPSDVVVKGVPGAWNV